MILRFPWAVAVASIVGCATFLALLAWGDPCAVAGYAGHPCPIVLSAPQENLRNAVFVMICLGVGFLAGSITDSRRYLAGSLTPPASAILTNVIAHYLYPVDSPVFRSDIPGAYMTAAVYILGLALLGSLGAAAARRSPNNRWRGP